MKDRFALSLALAAFFRFKCDPCPLKKELLDGIVLSAKFFLSVDCCSSRDFKSYV